MVLAAEPAPRSSQTQSMTRNHGKRERVTETSKCFDQSHNVHSSFPFVVLPSQIVCASYMEGHSLNEFEKVG